MWFKQTSLRAIGINSLMKQHVKTLPQKCNEIWKKLTRFQKSVEPLIKPRRSMAKHTYARWMAAVVDCCRVWYWSSKYAWSELVGYGCSSYRLPSNLLYSGSNEARMFLFKPCLAMESARILPKVTINRIGGNIESIIESLAFIPYAAIWCLTDFDLKQNATFQTVAAQRRVLSRDYAFQILFNSWFLAYITSITLYWIHSNTDPNTPLGPNRKGLQGRQLLPPHLNVEELTWIGIEASFSI